MNTLTRKALVLVLLLGCKGAQTSVDFTVRVGADSCKEDRDSGVDENEFVTLNCAKVDGEGTVRIRFPRREWWSIELRQSKPNVPGK